jgi:hypothetical protein
MVNLSQLPLNPFYKWNHIAYHHVVVWSTVKDPLTTKPLMLEDQVGVETKKRTGKMTVQDVEKTAPELETMEKKNKPSEDNSVKGIINKLVVETLISTVTSTSSVL